MADKEISRLPATSAVTSDTLIPVYQPGASSPAQKMTGKQFASFAREAAAADVQRAVDAADDAEASRTAAESAADRAEAARDSIILDEEKLSYLVEDAAGSAQSARNSADNAEQSAADALSAADRARAEADRATVPAVSGVYNVILTDRITAERYALIVENGGLKLLGVSESLDATDLTLIDSGTGVSYTVVIESGKLILEEV